MCSVQPGPPQCTSPSQHSGHLHAAATFLTCPAGKRRARPPTTTLSGVLNRTLHTRAWAPWHWTPRYQNHTGVPRPLPSANINLIYSNSTPSYPTETPRRTTLVCQCTHNTPPLCRPVIGGAEHTVPDWKENIIPVSEPYHGCKGSSGTYNLQGQMIFIPIP